MGAMRASTGPSACRDPGALAHRQRGDGLRRAQPDTDLREPIGVHTAVAVPEGGEQPINQSSQGGRLSSDISARCSWRCSAGRSPRPLIRNNSPSGGVASGAGAGSGKPSRAARYAAQLGGSGWPGEARHIRQPAPTQPCEEANLGPFGAALAVAVVAVPANRDRVGRCRNSRNAAQPMGELCNFPTYLRGGAKKGGRRCDMSAGLISSKGTRWRGVLVRFNRCSSHPIPSFA